MEKGIHFQAFKYLKDLRMFLDHKNALVDALHSLHSVMHQCIAQTFPASFCLHCIITKVIAVLLF